MEESTFSSGMYIHAYVLSGLFTPIYNITNEVKW